MVRGLYSAHSHHAIRRITYATTAASTATTRGAMSECDRAVIAGSMRAMHSSGANAAYIKYAPRQKEYPQLILCRGEIRNVNVSLPAETSVNVYAAARTPSVPSERQAGRVAARGPGGLGVVGQQFWFTASQKRQREDNAHTRSLIWCDDGRVDV